MPTVQSQNANCSNIWDYRLQDAHGVRRHYEPIWEEAMAWYMNLVRLDLPPGTEWMKQEMLADAFRFVEDLIPQYILSMLERPNHFTVRSSSPKGDEYNYQIQEYLKIALRQMQFVQRTVPAIRTGWIQGHIIQCTQWLRELGDRRIPVFANPVYSSKGELIRPAAFQGFEVVEAVRFNGAYTRYPDLFKVWKSPQTDNLGYHLWTAEEITLSVEYMEEVNRRYKTRTGQTVYQIDSLKRSISGRPRPDSTGFFKARYDSLFRFSGRMQGSIPAHQTLGEMYNRRSTVSRITGISDYTMLGSSGMTFMNCHGLMPPASEGGKDYDDTQWRTQLLGPDHEVVRDEPIQTWNVRPPHRDAPILQVGHEPYGRSPLHWVGPEIEQRSEYRSIRLADSYINLTGMTFKDKQVKMDENSLIKAPGVIGDVDLQGRSFKDAFYQLPRSPHNPEAFVEDSSMLEGEKGTVGLIQAFSGQPLGQRTSGTEAALIGNVGTSRARLQVMMLSLLLEERGLRDVFENSRVYDIEGRMISMPNQQGQQVFMSANELEYDADIFVDAGEMGNFDIIQLNAINQVIATVSQIPEAQSQIKWGDLAIEFLRKTGLDRADRFTRNPEEMKEYEDAQLLQALTQALKAQGANMDLAGAGSGKLPQAQGRAA